MRIGIIAEGAEDQAVIVNILRAFGIDKSDIVSIKPALQKDASDTNNPDDATIGTFQGVKNACLGYNGSRVYFERAFYVSGVDYIVIHLDAAEIDRHNFAFQRPDKSDIQVYSQELRAKMIVLINNWLNNQYTDQLLYAIAIEEIEAWCLAIYDQRDSTQSADAKKRLNSILSKTNVKFGDFDEISKGFRKAKTLKPTLQYNQSLHDFVTSVEVTLKKK